MTSRAIVWEWGVRIWKIEIIGSRELKASNQENSIIVGHLIWICLMPRKNQMSWLNSSFACCQIRPVEMGQKKMQLISIFSLEMDHLIWFCFAWCPTMDKNTRKVTWVDNVSRPADFMEIFEFIQLLFKWFKTIFCRLPISLVY